LGTGNAFAGDPDIVGSEQWAVGSGQSAVGSIFWPIFISGGGENPSSWKFIVKMRDG